MFSEPISYFKKNTNPTNHNHAVEYIGSNAEILILQFSAFCFFILSTIICRNASVKIVQPPATTSRKYPRYLSSLSHILVLVLAAFFLMSRWSYFGQTLFSSGFGSEARHALAPLMSISISALAYFSARETYVLKWAGGLSMVVALLSMIVSGLAAAAVHTFIAAALLFLLSLKIRPKRLLLVVGMTALVIPVAILVTSIPRGEIKNADSISAVTEYAVAKLTAKLIYRQTTSGHCLNGIYRNHRSAEGANPFFFASAIVPRALWPEKPILSRGSEYAEKYCGQSNAVKQQHSESVTLLGEPLLNGGIIGVVVAQLCIAIFFFTATKLLMSGQPAQVIFVVALLPWLATFEQHFAEYFGNLVKVMIIMLPLFTALVYLLWRHRKALT
jgi:hypothetical protein